MSTATVTRDARALLLPEDFEAVTATVLDNNPGLRRGVAERIIEQALAFVATAADAKEAMAPSRVVDEGWHALILHTRLYEALCRRLGRFVHHAPERPESTRDSYGPDWLTRTADAIAAAGFQIDADLWRGPEDDTIQVRAPAQHSPGPNCAPIVTHPEPKKASPAPFPTGTV
ncbi:glycine-rich domain-containing protein [Streptomyces radicis]|uniref:Uncharacterized protein n=1 Tax=Streptomyces radicis TaxID=1750517 RepID=A0A3A9WNK7_9ACTN|nr:hypothetical protein [Streptomyces radicis]RKN11064.1 hypothetical protein D7319_08110 [Streptomyces radicis]RKN25327.1 hypothetical protein D7318_08965 [Streptomyces radicis]